MKEKIISLFLLLVVVSFSYNNTLIIKFKKDDIIVDYSEDYFCRTTETYFFKVEKDRKKYPEYSKATTLSWGSFSGEYVVEDFYPFDGKRVIILKNGEVFIFINYKLKKQKTIKKGCIENDNVQLGEEGSSYFGNYILENEKKIKLNELIKNVNEELKLNYISDIIEENVFRFKPKEIFFYSNYMKFLRVGNYDYYEASNDSEYYKEKEEKIYKEYNIKYETMSFLRTEELIDYIEKLTKKF